MPEFKGTSNKAAIRQLWDLAIIQQRARETETDQQTNTQLGLSYFGLTGPSIEDLIDWADYLGLRTAVERLRKTPPEDLLADLRVHSKILSNVCAKGLSERF